MDPVQTFFMEPTDRGVLRLRDAKGAEISQAECSIKDYDATPLPKDGCKIWHPLLKRSDTGQLLTWEQAPVGATMLVESGYNMTKAGDCLAVKCPGNHTWYVDSRANNCTMPKDKAHNCWIRHGDPRQCNVHVDKDGVTCKAGAGSIRAPGWHGYLTHGKLQEGR